MERTYYHVAGEGWNEGEDLYCYDLLEQMGCAPDWKWNEAEVGFDGDVVSLFRTVVEAEEYRALHGGTICTVTITEAANLKIVRAEEGYDAVPGCIPAECVTVYHG